MSPEGEAGRLSARPKRDRAAEENFRGRTFAAAVMEGDEEAVAAAVRHHLPRLTRYVSRLGADPGLAEDIAQEALVRAVVCARRGRGPDRLGSWLYAVCTNLWRDAARAAEHRRTVVGLPVDGGSAAGDSPSDSDLDQAIVLREAVGQLPLALRAVVVLHFHEGLPLKEVAAVTGSPLGTVKWRMFTALRRLRSRLGPSVEGEGSE